MAAILSIQEALTFESAKKADEAAPSQEELTKKLMALIVLLQQIQTLLNGHTADDIARTVEQGKGMNILAEAQLTATQKAGQDIIDKLNEAENASWWQKLFGDILGCVMVLAGALLAMTGNLALGAVMIACGAISLAQTNNPEAIDKAITSLVGNSPLAKLAAKMAIISMAAIAGSAAGPAGAFMLAGSMAMASNIGQDCVALHIKINDTTGKSDEEIQKEAKESDTTFYVNMAIMAVATIGSIAGGIYSAGQASEATSSKTLTAIIQAVTVTGSIIGGLGSAGAGIANGIIDLELADAQENYAKIKGQTLVESQIQEIIAAIASFAQGFLKSQTKDTEGLNADIRSMFSDHSAFAKMYAQVVANKIN